MRAKIYQINADRDRHLIKFIGLESMKKSMGVDSVDSSLYDEVFNAELDTDNLEEIYTPFNTEKHPLHRGHALSVSDVVVTDKGAFFCDSVGFKQIEFDESQTQKPENLMRVPSQGNTAKQSREQMQRVTTAPAEKEQSNPTPKPTEPPTEKEEVDYSQVVSNLIAHGQQLGMVYNGSFGLGNAGWFPPTDISSYTDTAGATAACYGDVDYVPYYYAGLGAAPSDIMFNVIASGGQIYVVYG